ncbi:MAG: MATE family efflux transporter [Oscillospiraceae bacterium]
MTNNIYEQKSIQGLIFTFGIPSILSLIIEMLTGVVDTAFAGNLANIGADALSAMALISPILGIFIALQTLFAMSTGVLISGSLNDKTRQNHSYLTGVIMSGAMAISTSLLCGIFLPQILRALGADGQVFALAKQYMQIQLISNVMSSLGYTLTCCIRAFGFPKVELVIIGSSVLVNVVFNYIFAYMFKMGVQGLALGTLVSETTCVLLSVCFLIKKSLWLKSIKISAAEFIHTTKQLLKIGMAQTFIQILGGCTGFFINARLLSLGGITHVAAWSIVQRIYSLVLMPIVGLTQGVQNIISYFNGCHAKDKVQKTSKLTLMYCSGYGFFALILMFFAGNSFLHLFGGSEEILSIAAHVLLPVFIGFPFIGVLYTDMTLLQVTGHEIASVMLILSRQVFLLLPLIYIIPFAFSHLPFGISPVMSLFMCMPIADMLASVFALSIKKKLQN